MQCIAVNLCSDAEPAQTLRHPTLLACQCAISSSSAHGAVLCVSLAILQDVLARAMSYKPDDRPTLVEIMTALEQSVPELLAVQQKRLYEEEMARQQQVLQQQSMAVQLDMAVQQQVLVPPSMN